MRRGGLSSRTLIALVALCAVPASASAATVVPKTNKGGSCRIETIASRAGAAITFGGKVDSCSTRFGISSVEGRGLLYEEGNKLLVDITQAGSGLDPYERSQTFQGKAAAPYRAVWGATVTIRSRKSGRRPKKPEQWVDPGPNCRVYTTRHSSDTIGCTLDQDF